MVSPSNSTLHECHVFVFARRVKSERGEEGGRVEICRFCFGEDLRSGRGAMEMHLEIQQLKQSEAQAHIGAFRAERDAARAEMSALRAQLRSEQAEDEDPNEDEDPTREDD